MPDQEPLHPNDFPVVPDKDKIVSERGVPVATTPSPAVANDIARRLNEQATVRKRTDGPRSTYLENAGIGAAPAVPDLRRGRIHSTDVRGIFVTIALLITGQLSTERIYRSSAPPRCRDRPRADCAP